MSHDSADMHVHVANFEWHEWKLHLTLMLTGDDTQVLRHYCGRIVERMLRKIRLDDVVIKMPAMQERGVIKRQSVLGAWLSERVVRSAKQSFFSSSFLFKGLDAYKDAFLGKQFGSQLAGDLVLHRKRPLRSPDGCAGGTRDAKARNKAATSVGQRALGTVGHVAVGTMSVAGTVASTAAGTAGAAAGLVAQTVTDSVQGTPLLAATTAASTAKSAATSAASVASTAAATAGAAAGFVAGSPMLAATTAANSAKSAASSATSVAKKGFKKLGSWFG